MSRADLADHLRDPKVHAARLGEALVTGVGTVYMDPSKMKPGVLRGMHAAAGALGAGAVVAGLRATPVSMATKVGAGAGVGALLVGVSVIGIAADGAAERWLTRRGVKRPRVVMGVALGAFTLAARWAEDFFDEPEVDSELETEFDLEAEQASEDVAGTELY